MPKTGTTKGSLETRSSRALPTTPAISYKLSDKAFLDLGWTYQPDVPRVFPVVTMKAKFSRTAISPWFQERYQKEVKKYAGGSPLYVCNEDGTGRIFYPNGKPAVVIEKGGKNRHRTRIWVTGPGETDKKGTPCPAKLCALFDSLGNGVVYDRHGNQRLAYTQTHGVLWDSPSGRPVYWKWHDLPYTGSVTTINEDDEEWDLLPLPKRKVKCKEPPVPVVPEKGKKKVAEKDAGENKLPVQGSPAKTPSLSSPAYLFAPEEYFSDTEVVEIRNYVNTGKIKPPHVAPLKPIILHLNQYLSLRIFNQADVVLVFMAEGQSTRLKIGVLYNPLDKLKVTKVDMKHLAGRVNCPFEIFPVRTRSMSRFQESLHRLRNSKHERV